MSNTTAAATAATDATVTNLAESRKEMAEAKKRHPATQSKEAATKAAPAKAAPAKKAAEKPAKKEKDGTLYTYKATGRAGITNTRTFPSEMVVAADVKDENHPSPRWKAGVITRFFASQAMAEKYAARQRETGVDVVLVAVELVETKTA